VTAACLTENHFSGAVSALSLLGPAFGFLLGSVTTAVWVDSGWPNTTMPAGLSDKHHDWVGAWWIGYLVTGFLLLVVTIPFCAFPR